MTKRPSMGTLEFVVLFGLINSLAALGIDALLPAMRVLEGAMNVTEPNRIQLVVSMFILGAVFGELVAGPLADAYGRKIIVLSGLGIFFAGSIVSMMAVDLDQLLLGRIIQGFGVSGPKIASRAMIRDQFSGDAMARIMSFIFMVFILVPMIAPAIGQWAMNIAGWEAIFIMYLIMAGIGFLWLSIRQGETLLPEKRLPLSASTIFRNVGLIIQNKRVMAYTISVGFVFGGIINYLGIAQALFFDIYGIDQQFPLYFAMLAGGIGLSLFANSQLVMHFGMYRISIVAQLGLIVLSSALFAVTYITGQAPSLFIFMACGMGIFFCCGFLFGNLNSMAMNKVGRVAGLGASVVTSFSSIISVGIAYVLGLFYDQTIIPLLTGFLTGGVVGMALLLLSNKFEDKDV
ncbi:MAG: multidrug effflux MFS transporter [Rhizobiaceae bacterium]|nr:multidrug effflux MFS transporter [Rhizobiaceae bacterium]